MKAIILAAGRGKRLKEKTEPANKSMLTFKDRHLIEYSLETAKLSKVDEIIIVVGYRAADIVNKFGIQYANIKVRYVIQEEQRGLVNALEYARDALDGDDFILLLADEIMIHPNPQEMIATFKNENLFVMCGVTRVEDRSQISKTYTVICNETDNRIYRLIEKPRNPETPSMTSWEQETVFLKMRYLTISLIRLSIMCAKRKNCRILFSAA